jgi:biopolymer transport protein ExbB/TolQ
MNPWTAFSIGLFAGIALLVVLQVLAERIREDVGEAEERED